MNALTRDLIKLVDMTEEMMKEKLKEYPSPDMSFDVDYVNSDRKI